MARLGPTRATQARSPLPTREARRTPSLRLLPAAPDERLLEDSAIEAELLGALARQVLGAR